MPSASSLNSDNPYSIEVFRSIREASALWDSTKLTNNIFLSYDYLATVESFPPKGMQFRYAVVLQNSQVIGLVYTQIVYFNGGESIRYHQQGPPPRCFFQTFGQNLKGLVARQVGFNTLVCGNLMLSGPHGFAFSLPGTQIASVLELVLTAIRSNLDKDGIQVSMTLVKDFEPSKGPSPSSMKRYRFHGFQILPSLIMPLHPAWQKYGDYLSSLSSKYRVRANKARQVMKNKVVKRVMTIAEIETYQETIHRLYLQIVDDSGFNIVTLHPGYLGEMARRLGPAFIMQGYFVENELIGFCSAVVNTNGELEAHFLGYEEVWNPSAKLYLNMLLDLLDMGIMNRCNRVIFARTADEIKSSVGASSVQLDCYIRHRSHFSNKFIRPILDYLSPDEEPIMRHPFKQEFQEQLVDATINAST